ncbi:hypothetical protein GOV04_03895 [Candidatus Woesearchaeota archaeon]|nr:hypothetical protein [Candidatus Woesearchaeota archaeon]
MTTLVSIVSTGKGSWAQLYDLIKHAEFKKIILVTNDFGKEKFTPNDRCELIIINDTAIPIEKLAQKYYEQLKNKVSGVEVALNIISGSGKEHMALLSALLKLGLAIRLVTSSGTELVEL